MLRILKFISIGIILTLVFLMICEFSIEKIQGGLVILSALYALVTLLSGLTMTSRFETFSSEITWLEKIGDLGELFLDFCFDTRLGAILTILSWLVILLWGADFFIAEDIFWGMFIGGAITAITLVLGNERDK